MAADTSSDATSGKEASITLKYSTDKVVGNGSFGVVYLAKIVETGEAVAIKKVLQDRRYKNRELQVIKMLSHPNVVTLKHYFHQKGEKDEEVYLNLVLEYLPDTVHSVNTQYAKAHSMLPPILIKLFTYQMFRSLAYLHGIGICHRDIKPQNLLVDARRGVLKLCDFGSAKELVPGTPSVAYICSRYYRAPELIFGATEYTNAIDVWSAGCVMAELFLGQPLFPGETANSQLSEIVKVLGTPTAEQLRAMNPAIKDTYSVTVAPYPWAKVFKSRASEDAVDLLSQMLRYEPDLRVTAMRALVHPYFDELRTTTARLPTGEPLPPLFNMTYDELNATPRDLLALIVPPHARTAANFPPDRAGVALGPAATAAAGGAAAGGAGAAPPTAPPAAAAPRTATAGTAPTARSGGSTAVLPSPSAPRTAASTLPGAVKPSTAAVAPAAAAAAAAPAATAARR